MPLVSPAGPLEVFTVSELNRQARRLLESRFTPVWLEGEISNFKHHTSGHMYFALKDDRAQVAAVMFASTNRALGFSPSDGQKVLARGNITLYEARGQFQLVVQNLYPSGAGELWLAYEALKGKLQAEGLFDGDRKTPLPAFPRRIGVITSPTGAAVQDIINIIARRAPHMTLVVRPTLMQGKGAKEDIVAAVRAFDAYGKVDLVILARGGGSLEDLWPFNEEEVARAVAACRIPTLSAVGHETDLTICDLVADVRAPTPSAAAELAAGEREGYLQILDERTETMERIILRRLDQWRRKLADLQSRYAFRQPAVHIGQQKEQLDRQAIRLQRAMRQLVGQKTQILRVVAARLSALSPENVLQRGYALVTDGKTGQLVARRGQLQVGQALNLRFKDGSAGAEVTQLEGN